MLGIWWDQVGDVYYELLNLIKTISRALYRAHLMKQSWEFKTTAPTTTTETMKLLR